MRRWLWLIALLWCSQVWATVTLGHTNSASVSITGTGTAVTVTSIPSGHFVMGTVVWDTAGRTLSSCTATSSTCVVDTGCHGTLSGVGAIDCFYILSAGATLTSITLTASATTTGNWYINDYSTTAGPMAKDTECTGTPASSSTPAGCNLTLSGTNDVILQAISCSQTCSGTPSGWTNGVNTSGDGQADKQNTNSGTGPTWAQSPAGTSLVGGFALKETGGGGTTSAPQVFVIRP